MFGLDEIITIIINTIIKVTGELLGNQKRKNNEEDDMTELTTKPPRPRKRITASTGEPCPRTGSYYSNQNPQLMRNFQAGEPMPLGVNKDGMTLERTEWIYTPPSNQETTR